MPDGTKLRHEFVDRITADEDELPHFFQSAKAANDGLAYFDYKGGSFKIAETVAEWNRMRPDERSAFLAKFGVEGKYDHTLDKMYTTHRALHDHTIIAEEIFHAMARRLKNVNPELYDKMVTENAGKKGARRFIGEDQAFHDYINGRKTGTHAFKWMKRGTELPRPLTPEERVARNELAIARRKGNVAPENPTAKQEAGERLLQAAQERGHIAHENDIEAMVAADSGIDPDYLDQFTIRDAMNKPELVPPAERVENGGRSNWRNWKLTKEGRALKPYVAEGNAVSDREADRITEYLTTTRAEKYQKAAEYFHDENEDPALQKDAETVLGKPVARTEAEASPEDSHGEGEGELPQAQDEVPFAARKKGEDEENPHTLPDSAFVRMKETTEWLRSHYFEKGLDTRKASSLTTPAGEYPWKVGQWRIDDHVGAYGHSVEQLREFDPHKLDLSEDDYTKSNMEGRGNDARRYADWIREGKTPPPAEVVETDDGKMRVTDGHRRVAAAKMANKTILAWVSPRMETGSVTIDGRPIYTGLTREGAVEGKKASAAEQQRLMNGVKARDEGRPAFSLSFPDTQSGLDFTHRDVQEARQTEETRFEASAIDDVKPTPSLDAKKRLGVTDKNLADAKQFTDNPTPAYARGVKTALLGRDLDVKGLSEKDAGDAKKGFDEANAKMTDQQKQLAQGIRRYENPTEDKTYGRIAKKFKGGEDASGAMFAVRKRPDEETPGEPAKPEDQDTRPDPTLFGAYDKGPTGVRNAITALERETRNLPGAADVVRRGYSDTVLVEARAQYDGNRNAGEALVKRIEADPTKPITDTDDAVLTIHQVDLQNQFAGNAAKLIEAKEKGDDAGAEAARLESARLSDELLRVYNAGKKAGTANARGLAARRILMNEDYTYAGIETRVRAAKGGERLTPEDSARIKEMSDKIKDLQAQVDGFQKKHEAALRRQKRTLQAEALEKDVNATKSLSKPRDAVLMQKRASIVSVIREKLSRLRGATFAVRPEGEISPPKIADRPGPEAAFDVASVDGLGSDLRALERTFIEGGMKDREARVKAVHAEIKDVIPEMTERDVMDALSGYGKFKTPSADEVDKEMRQGHAWMQAAGKLLDVIKNLAPKRSGFQRGELDDATRRLQQQVREEMKTRGIEVTDPVTQLKSALQARKTALRNSIADLEFQISKRAKIVREKAPTPEDAETLDLGKRRDALRQEFDDIFGKPGRSYEEMAKAAVKAAERETAELEKRVKENDLFRQQQRTPENDAMKAARAKRDAAREELEALKASDAGYRQMVKDKAEAQKIAEIEAKIAANTERIATGDTKRKANPAEADSPEVAALREQNSKLNDTLSQIRKEQNAGNVNALKQAAAFKSEIERLEKQVAEKSRQIAQSDVFPMRGEKAGALTPEGEALRDQIARLNKTISEKRRELTGKVDSHQKEIERLESRIQENQRRIAENDIGPASKKADYPKPADVAALLKQNDKLLDTIEKMKKDAAPPGPSPEEVALQARKASMRRRMADLAEKMATKDFGPPEPKVPLVMDAEGQRLERDLASFKDAADTMEAKARHAATPRWQRAIDLIPKWSRMGILSGYHILAKLTAAATARSVVTPIEELAGAGISKLLPKLAARAPRQGGASLEAEVSAITDGLVRKMPEVWQKMKTGKTDLDLLYGKKEWHPQSWMDFFGHLHGALKEPVRQMEWQRSFAKRQLAAARDGVNVSDPAVMMRNGQLAFQDAQRAIFMQENIATKAYNASLALLASRVEKGGAGAVSAKLIQALIKSAFPIVHIPTNIVAETGEYVFGTAIGSVRAGAAFKAGIEKVDPVVADSIMRQLKKGSIGAAATALGFAAYASIGGFDQKKKHPDVKPGEMSVFGIPIPKLLLHHPIFEAMQIGATLARVMYDYNRKTGQERGLSEGAYAAMLGLLDEVPFVRGSADVAELVDPNQRDSYLNRKIASMAIPGVVQQVAEDTDAPTGADVLKNMTLQAGEENHRRTDTLGDTLRSRVPGLRSTLPQKR